MRQWPRWACHRRHDVPVVAVNARDPESVAALDQWLRPGVTAALW